MTESENWSFLIFVSALELNSRSIQHPKTYQQEACELGNAVIMRYKVSSDGCVSSFIFCICTAALFKLSRYLARCIVCVKLSADRRHVDHDRERKRTREQPGPAEYRVHVAHAPDHERRRPEVGDLGHQVHVEQDVGRLDVAVHECMYRSPSADSAAMSRRRSRGIPFYHTLIRLHLSS